MIKATVSATAGSSDQIVEVHDSLWEKRSDPSFCEPGVCVEVDERVYKNWASCKSVHLSPMEARALARELVLAADRAEQAAAERGNPG